MQTPNQSRTRRPRRSKARALPDMTPWLTAALFSAAVALAASAAMAQVGKDAEVDRDLRPGTTLTPGTPPSAVPDEGLGVAPDPGVTLDRDLGTRKDLNIDGRVSREGATSLDDDRALVGPPADKGSFIAEELAEPPEDPIGASPGVGIAPESNLDADGAAETTLD